MVYSDTLKQIDPHLSKLDCDNYLIKINLWLWKTI